MSPFTPTPFSIKNVTVTLTRPDVPFTDPPTFGNAGALTARITVEVVLPAVKPRAIEGTWALVADPAGGEGDARVSPATGKFSALPRSNLRADPFYDVSFESTLTFTPDAHTLAESVEVLATVNVASLTSSHEKIATLVVPVEYLDLVPGAPPVALACQASPETGPTPLTVAFDASGRNCVGRCQFRWDFGDGESATDGRTTHVYQRARRYTAVGYLTDTGRGTSECNVEIVATAPVPTSTPTPGPNQPPVIGAITFALSPANILTIRVTAPISDPDGNVPTWTLAVVATPPGATATPAPAAGTGSPVSSLLTLSAEGTYRIRITADDGRGGTDVEEGSFLYDRPSLGSGRGAVVENRR